MEICLVVKFVFIHSSILFLPWLVIKAPSYKVYTEKMKKGRGI